MHQTKPFTTYTEQIELLRNRGMIIPDADKAQKFRERRNYYRLSGYWYPMRVFPDSTDKKGAGVAGVVLTPSENYQRG
ncbi:hypothetical protein [Lawsonella clevelandensis]|uniref:hypothetical protein n=1 Tax=Lawsonella clevelandensis TaxID=1528099 RepID=UPI0023F2969B|nr:hypothetical protein [Lawsonella clevelandensis]